MQTFQGIAVSSGVAFGEAFVFDNEGFRIPRRFVEHGTVVDDEIRRLRAAVKSVSSDLERNRDDVAEQLGSHYAAIFSAQLQMLCDPSLQNEIEAYVRERNYSPEYAVARTMRRFAKVFQNLESTYMAERAHDIVDIEKRLLGGLLGRQREELSRLTSPVIVMAHNLTPSETASLDKEFTLGFVSELGGAGGHTAIVAEALEIPAVVGTGPILSDISGGDQLIIDGDNGLVIVHPDDDTIARYRQEKEQQKTHTAQLETLRDRPAITLDGERIWLKANIEFPREATSCVARGADGIGLYRTEFLYLGTDQEPTEQTHFDAYAEVIKTMNGRPVVMRTLDLGADKMGHQPMAGGEEKNPFLGLRSIRLSLRNIELFKTQLRAILRASVHGDVRVMFPLISTLQELRHAKLVLSDIMEDLEEEGIPFNRDLQVGMMVEVPASVMMMDRFVRETDFISIGTNDLIQYTLAVDRSNKDVASLYNASDPAVLKLIHIAVQAANKQAIPATLCGQMSANTLYTMLLIGLGLRSLSVPSNAIPDVKNVCLSVTVDQCNRVAEKALDMDNAQAISDYLRQELRNAVEKNNYSKTLH
jgi:phosphotransferase system enzyme I (PtsI)